MIDVKDCKQRKLISPGRVEREIDKEDEMITGGQAEREWHSIMSRKGTTRKKTKLDHGKIQLLHMLADVKICCSNPYIDLKVTKSLSSISDLKQFSLIPT